MYALKTMQKMQDASFDARAAMLGAVRKRLLRNDLKMRWATPLALGAVDVERENADAARLALDSWASRRRAALAVAARRAAVIISKMAFAGPVFHSKGHSEQAKLRGQSSTHPGRAEYERTNVATRTPA